jgi:hypothetical protein
VISMLQRSIAHRRSLARKAVSVHFVSMASTIAAASVTSSRSSAVSAASSYERKVRDKTIPRRDYRASVWWQALQDPNTKDPQTKAGKKFRLRFRVPFPLFQELVALAKVWFPQADTDIVGRPSVPIELKVLCWLRVLGRGSCFDDCEECTGADEETLRTFFHKFSSRFAKEKFREYVKPPTELSEIHAAESIYSRLGLPGCIASTDCTHLSWDVCPACKLRSICNVHAQSCAQLNKWLIVEPKGDRHASLRSRWATIT